MTALYTSAEAYKAMYMYLEQLYTLTKSDDLAGFLGGMTLLNDGLPADSAVWSDWLECLQRVKNNLDE